MTCYTSTILCKAFTLYHVHTDNMMDFFSLRQIYRIILMFSRLQFLMWQNGSDSIHNSTC